MVALAMAGWAMPTASHRPSATAILGTRLAPVMMPSPAPHRRVGLLCIAAMAPPKPAGNAKKEMARVTLALPAGKATPAPPVGPALGVMGVNIMAFCNEYNAQTAGKSGIIPAEITVYDDRSFTFVLGSPDAAASLVQFSKAPGNADVAKSSGLKPKIGKITADQVREIAKEKMADLRTKNIQTAMRIIARQAQYMGIVIDPPIRTAKGKKIV